MFPEPILMFKSLGNFAFKFSPVTYILLDIKLPNLLNLEDLAGLSEGWGSTLSLLRAFLTP